MLKTSVQSFGLLAALLVACCSAVGQVSGPAESSPPKYQNNIVVDQPCEHAAIQVRQYLEKHGVELPEVQGCVSKCSAEYQSVNPAGHGIFTSLKVTNAAGKTVSSKMAERNYGKYSEENRANPTKLRKGYWISYGKLTVTGRATFESQGVDRCRVELLNHYDAGYAVMWYVIFPVDGDGVSFESNGLLEKEWLEAILSRASTTP